MGNIDKRERMVSLFLILSERHLLASSGVMFTSILGYDKINPVFRVEKYVLNNYFLCTKRRYK